MRFSHPNDRNQHQNVMLLLSVAALLRPSLANVSKQFHTIAYSRHTTHMACDFVASRVPRYPPLCVHISNAWRQHTSAHSSNGMRSTVALSAVIRTHTHAQRRAHTVDSGPVLFWCSNAEACASEHSASDCRRRTNKIKLTSLSTYRCLCLPYAQHR